MRRQALLLCAALVLTGTAGCDKVLGIEEYAFVAEEADGGGGVGGVSALSTTGYDHTCALLSTGNVRCWGRDEGVGQLGYGITGAIGDDELPASAGDVSVGGTVAVIAGGASHTCVLLASGKVRCWGAGASGEHGYGTTDAIGDDELPSSAGDVDVGGTVARITAGARHTCTLLSGDDVRCWGSGENGRLGYGNSDDIGDDELPSAAGMVDVGGIVTQIAAGGRHTCALLFGGRVRCWGLAGSGRLGYGNNDDIGDDELPSSAGDVDVGGTVTQISGGGQHTCALLSTGNVRCWGLNSHGQLGYGHTGNIGDDELPSSAGDVNVGGTVTQIAAGELHTCALLSTGRVRCWGNGAVGLLGYGNSNTIGDDEVPAVAGDVDLGGTVTGLMVGTFHQCALLSTGTVRCWGGGLSGRLGYGNIENIGDDELPASAGDVCIVGTESSCR